MSQANITNHPASCKDPDNCTLSYREHLLGFVVSANATPNRRPVNLSNNIRESRWHRDIAAYKQLRKDGFQPPRIDGSALRLREGKTQYDMETRPVTIDYNDGK